MKTHPAIGNLVIVEQPTTVEFRLITDRDGIACFTYREIAQLAAFLATIREPDSDDDWKDLV